MGRIPIRIDAALAMTQNAREYSKANGEISTLEMGAALLLAGATLVSPHLTDVQLDELCAYVKGVTAELRKANAS